MTTVLLCAEGKHDVGKQNVWSAQSKCFVDFEGWLQPLVRAVLGPTVDFEVKTRSSLFRIPGSPKPATGHGDKSYLAKRAAALEGCDLVIFMVDADSASKKRHQDVVGEIVAGFDAYQDQNVGCIACVPLSASEAWLLSDVSAWNVVSGVSVTGLPNQPETIWGARDNPNGDHPHQFFSRICNLAVLDDNSETRRALSERIDLSTIRQRCPISFVAFERSLNNPGYA